MKFPIVLSFLLASTTAFVVQDRSTSKAEACLQLSYLDELESSTSKRVSSLPTVSFLGEDAETTGLAASLGLDDTVIRNEYGRWLARYDKCFELSRYPQFKKNFLIQFQSDLKYGKFYTLNEFGDCTEGISKPVHISLSLGITANFCNLFTHTEEFVQLFNLPQQEVESAQANEEEMVEIIDDVDLGQFTTQPRPAAILAAEACSRALRSQFSAIVNNLGANSFHILADLICRNSAGKK